MFRSSQAFELGITKGALAHRLRRGWVLRVVKGLYRLRDHPWTWHSEAQAAVLLAGWGAVLSHGAAARVHGFWAYRGHKDFDVSIPEGTHHRQRIGRLHITSWTPDAHVVVIEGLPVTTVARTCFDLAGDVPRALRNDVGRQVHANHIRRVLNDALRNRGLSLLHETAVLAALAGRGRSGTVLIRSLIEEFGPEYEPTDSDGEDLFLEILRAFVLPEPRLHVVISDEEGFIAEVDCLFDPGLIVEIDGATHQGPLDRAHDRARDARLRAIGHAVERVRYRRLLTHPAGVARDVRRWLSDSN